MKTAMNLEWNDVFDGELSRESRFARNRVVGRFTLIELLFVISIIAILASMLLPALKKARDKGNQAVCGSNLKQLTTSIFMYANDFEGWIPTTWYFDHSSWHQTYLEPNGYAPKLTYNPPSGVWACPSEHYKSAVGTCTHYSLNRFASNWGYWRKLPRIRRPSKTVLLFDTSVNPTWEAYSYYNYPTHPKNITAQRHNGGRNYSFADGHVKWGRPLEAINDFIWEIPP